MSSVAFVALGSNLGDRAAHLAFARARLHAIPRSRVVASSDVEETDPLGGLDQPRYLNQMVALETGLDPRELLAELHEIEAARGRERSARWASRTLDLDLVLHGDVELHDPDLVLPHPGLASRDFWQRQLSSLRARMAASG